MLYHNLFRLIGINSVRPKLHSVMAVLSAIGSNLSKNTTNINQSWVIQQQNGVFFFLPSKHHKDPDPSYMTRILRWIWK